MDEIYGQLLRSGKGSVSRHYELTGALADAEAKNNPQYAHVQAILAVPTSEGQGQAQVADAGTAQPASSAASKPAGAAAATSAPASARTAAAPAAAPAGQAAPAAVATPAAAEPQAAQPVAWYWRVLGY